jgi:predicted MFS family arabinose efflux permease
VDAASIIWPFGPCESGQGAAVSELVTDTPAAPDRRALRWVILALAVASGLAVANIYYAQPLLAPIARAFGVSQGSAALVVTVTQFGYALGIVALMPLGDLLENRSLAARTLVVTALALFAAAFAPDFAVFLVVSVLIGLTSVVAQIVVPFAAHLAPDAERGRVVGSVMTGLLLGILLARTAASLVAAAWGWQAIYVISGVLVLGCSVMLTRMLPKRRPERSTYGALMRSVLHLVRDEPALRRRAVCQGMLFAAFSAYWTSVSFELISRYGLTQTGIGIFALVGAAGAAAAPLAGWLGDRGFGVGGSGVALTLGVAAMLLAGFGADNLVLLAASGVLLDLAVQGHQVFSQREIYALRADARSRINTVFMTTIFVCGSVGSALSGVLLDHLGWFGVTMSAAALPFAGLLIWAGSRVLAHRRA